MTRFPNPPWPRKQFGFFIYRTLRIHKNSPHFCMLDDCNDIPLCKTIALTTCAGTITTNNSKGLSATFRTLGSQSLLSEYLYRRIKEFFFSVDNQYIKLTHTCSPLKKFLSELNDIASAISLSQSN
jgi:hypothetical protein